MSTTLKPERVKAAPPVPAAKAPAAPAPAAPADAAPAPSAEAERPSDAWVGDRIAMAVWMSAALILAFLLLKDIIFSVLFGRS
jgi:hypothetical protein